MYAARLTRHEQMAYLVGLCNQMLKAKGAGWFVMQLGGVHVLAAYARDRKGNRIINILRDERRR